MKPQAPCKDCTERHPNCHSECDNYKTFRELLDEYNANSRSVGDYLVNWYNVDRSIKYRKK